MEVGEELKKIKLKKAKGWNGRGWSGEAYVRYMTRYGEGRVGLRNGKRV